MSYLYEKYDYSLFRSRFCDYGRQDQFPRGLRELFEYLNNFALETGEPIEVDVIALCCEYTELDIETALKETGCNDLDELKDNTTVIAVDDETIIYQVF